MQSKAYEIRISDWSSDVCSSDLRHVPDVPVRVAAGHRLAPIPHQPALFTLPIALFFAFPLVVQFPALRERKLHLCPAPAVEINRPRHQRHALPRNGPMQFCDFALVQQKFPGAFRSEEHTSELTSLMRFSYS